MRKRLFSADHPDKNSLNCLGTSYSELGDQNKAIEYYEKSDIMKKKILID